MALIGQMLNESAFFQSTREAYHRLRCLGDSVELVCKPKEVAVCPDRSDLTPPLQTRDRTRRVCTLCLFNYTYLLSLGMDQLVWYVYSITRDREASLAHSDYLLVHCLS